ncbi:MAG: hypothetical protein ACOX0K_03545 [Oscillospiraceae bacterium]|jgi:hypothetical protein
MKGMPLRGFAEILDDIYHLTNQMAEQRHDPDFLIEGVEKRQALMNEYDALALVYPEERKAFEQDPISRDRVAKMIAMDRAVAKALEEHKASAHQDVAAANARQKVLDYLGKSHPSGGNLMDYRK